MSDLIEIQESTERNKLQAPIYTKILNQNTKLNTWNLVKGVTSQEKML